ncbi:MAG: hypothetical protein QW228_06945 [Candidatus Aenigmatarchaeota archaeon]
MKVLKTKKEIAQRLEKRLLKKRKIIAYVNDKEDLKKINKKVDVIIMLEDK